MMTRSNWNGTCSNDVMNCLKWILAIAVLTAWASGAQEPTIEVLHAAEFGHPGQPYRVDYVVRWEGAPGSYGILPPQIEAIDWGEMNVLETVASTEGDVNVVSHSVEFIPREVGEYAIPDARVGFIDTLVARARAASDSGVKAPALDTLPELEAAGFKLQVRPNHNLFWVSSGLTGIALAVSGGLAFVVLHRRGGSLEGMAPVVIETPQSAMNLARQHRLDGQYYDFILELKKAVSFLDLDEPAEAVLARLEDLAQNVGFRGLQPSEDDISGAERDVERLLARPKTIA